MKNFKTIFMGTPHFALPSLQGLVESEYAVLAVVTQPDRRRGRGKKMLPSPVKRYALEHNLPCLQPARVRDPEFILRVKEMAPDLIVTAAYGQILPSQLLKVPTRGCINVHASLLPLYRGGAPVQRAIMAGEEETGVTIYYMDSGMDTGDIILQEKIAVLVGETGGELMQRLADLGGGVLKKAVKLIQENAAFGIPQDAGKATYADLIFRDEERIDWFKNGAVVANQINALSPIPGAYVFFRGKRLKMLRAVCLDLQGETGQTLQFTPEGFVVAAAKGAVLITEVQPAGKNAMPAREFVNGYQLNLGQNFVHEGDDV